MTFFIDPVLDHSADEDGVAFLVDVNVGGKLEDLFLNKFCPRKRARARQLAFSALVTAVDEYFSVRGETSLVQMRLRLFVMRNWLESYEYRSVLFL